MKIVKNGCESISGPGLRAAGYFRVSTGKQAESDLSIPDQRSQTASYCQSRSWLLIAEFVEPGMSATDDNRPEFQRMIERATDDDHPYDVIVVHSYSRFFRDGFALEMYVRKLAKANVRLVSITQELGDDPAQVMMRQIIGLFDEYQSREIGKHVLRSMKENARQGFYNGSRLPLGYRAEEVEKRGARVKKRIIVDAVEAEIVKMIFQLYLRGDGTTGPLGVKSIASWLNGRGFRTKNNGRFGSGTVHKILTNRTYVGEYIFNRGEWKTRRKKPVSEHIVIPVPAIIDLSEFEAVQAALVQRSPRVTPPRVVTGPILLTGLVFCSHCGGAMTLRTGTSRNGTVHRYYSCSTNIRVGKTGCTGYSIRMDALDEVVVDHLASRLLTLDRLTELIASITASRVAKAAEIDKRIAGLRREATDAEIRLKRLYRTIEDGIAEMDDLLRDRIDNLKRDRERAQMALERVSKNVVAATEITQEMIATFASTMRENITIGEVPFRKAYIRSVVERIQIDEDVIQIMGSKVALERAVTAERLPSPPVRSFERKWRPLQDSNLRQPA